MTTTCHWATDLVCSKTGTRADLESVQFLSPAGKPWLVRYDLDPAKGKLLAERLGHRPWTLWRYRELLPVRDYENRVDLGEGGTPLVPSRRFARSRAKLWLKQEAGNPTGSFKDRGLTLAVNRARELGATGLELPSAGNAAIALSAYGAAAGLPVRVAMPEDTPPAVVERCEGFGAEVHRVGRTLVESGAFLRQNDRGYWSLATLREPYRAEGKKTMGLEIAEQMRWDLPEWIIYPTGGGTGIVGMAKAFDELEALGLIGSRRPRFVVVQSSGCAPLVEAFEQGREEAVPWPDPRTAVWGLRVPAAIADFLILRAVRQTGGTALAIDDDLLPTVATSFQKSEGLIVGPEGAAALLAFEQLVEAGRIEPHHRVVVFQTGHPCNYS